MKHRAQKVMDFKNDNEFLCQFVASMAKHSKDLQAVIEAVANAYEILRLRAQEEREEGSITINNLE